MYVCVRVKKMYFACLFVGGKVGAHTRDTKTDRETS